MIQCCTSLDLPSQNLPSIHFWPLHCRKTGAGQQQEESGGQGLTSQDSQSPLSLSAASLSVKGRSSWTLSLRVLPSYSAPSLQEWSPLVPLGCGALEMRGADSECKEQLRNPCNPPPPPAHPPMGTLGWAEPHPCSPRCARYTSCSGASGKSSLSGQNHAGISMEVGTRTQSPVLPPQRSAGSLCTLK